MRAGRAGRLVQTWLVALAVAVAGVAAIAATPAAAGAAMQFRLVPLTPSDGCATACPLIIQATGEIDRDTPEAFLAFLRAQAETPNLLTIVGLSSSGGRVVAAMELGTIMRRLGLAIVVEQAVEGPDGRTRFVGAGCYSACAYLLMGGAVRVVPPESEVGLHRMFAFQREGEETAPAGTAEAGRIYDDGSTGDLLRAYAKRMGVSPQAITVAEGTPSEAVHLVTASELRRWKLARRRL